MEHSPHQYHQDASGCQYSVPVCRAAVTIGFKYIGVVGYILLGACVG